MTPETRQAIRDTALAGLLYAGLITLGYLMVLFYHFLGA